MIKKFFKIIFNELYRLINFSVIFFPTTRSGDILRKKYYRYILKDKIGRDPKICFGCIIYKYENLIIGENFHTGNYVTIDPGDSFGIIIGNNVGIAQGTYVRAGNHGYSSTDKPILEQGHVAKKIFTQNGEEASIIIEDDVWIGANCVILSGAKIGKGAIIGAGSVVMSEIPEYSIAMGNPAKVFSSRKAMNFSKGYYQFS